MAEPGCEQVLDHVEELALGVAEARQRALAIAHLERCASCRRELAGMAEVADSLAALVPAVEPPRDFESRVVAALVAGRQGGERPPAARRGGRRRRSVLVAAVVLAAAAAATAAAGGLELSGSPGTSHPLVLPKVVTAELLASGRPVGQVVISRGHQPWISMAISGMRGAATDAELTCELRTGAGSALVVGSMWLSRGNGYWAGPLRIGRVTVTAAVVLGPGGAVLASASIPAAAVRPPP